MKEDLNARDAAIVSNGDGMSPFVVLCDHASRRIPERYGDLGLMEAELTCHIAWDLGASAVSATLSEILDAPLVQSSVSRLVIDCNRRLDAPNLIWTQSEATRIVANEGIDEAERQYRIDHFYLPYHEAIADVLNRRQQAGRETILVCVHSFTPVYNGVPRPWPIGLIHGKHEGYTRGVFDALTAQVPEMQVGWNEPYAAKDGVTFTLERHGDARGLAATMIEIRNTEILEPAGVGAWAERLARCLEIARVGRPGTSES
jgi:predicted N-formylglutamate amidohydrolase